MNFAMLTIISDVAQAPMFDTAVFESEPKYSVCILLNFFMKKH
jgi:hypothetical protein